MKLEEVAKEFVGKTRGYFVRLAESSTLERIEKLESSLKEEGYEISFGNIGLKSTYCLLSKGDDEIVGYTFIKNLKYKNNNIGTLKALQQAIARKDSLKQKDSGDLVEDQV